MDKIYNKYETKQTYLSLAGSGDPWSYLSKTRKNILGALHDRIPLSEIASIFGMSLEELQVEIKPLIDSSLVKEENNCFLPTFLIADSKEVRLVYEHSKEIGKLLADVVIANWSVIQNTFKDLSISEDHTISDQGFMLVGSRILDIGLLGELVRESSLLEQAPLRPSPTRHDARYYFWMIEGDAKYLGSYGQEDLDLPWAGWHALNFGQSSVEGRRNEARDSAIEGCEDLRKSNKAKSPMEFAEILGIPFLDKKDSEIWNKFSKNLSKLLVGKINENSEKIRSLFQTLESSKYANNSFGEFVCWYIHLVYPFAIDFLIEKKLIKKPKDYYSEIILYNEKPEGLLAEK